MKIFFSTFGTLFLFLFAKGQIGNNWYFPLQAGLTFNTYPPTLQNNSVSKYARYTGQGLDGICSSISDLNGQLLFYNNADTIWNKNHQVLDNGFEFSGIQSLTSQTFIIPQLNNSGKYYLFSIGDGPPYNSRVLSSTEIDIHLSGGLGAAYNKNRPIIDKVVPFFVVVNNESNCNEWIITHKDSTNEFVAIKIGANMYNPGNFIYSAVGPVLTNYIFTGNQLKVSNGTNLIALYNDNDKFLYLFKFNNNTGQLSAPLKIKQINSLNYICYDFSNDGKKLYVATSDFSIFPSEHKISQYDLTVYDSAAIENSKFNIYTTTTSTLGYTDMQNAIDGRLYILQGWGDISVPSRISVVANPNATGFNCNFVPNLIQLNTHCFSLPTQAPASFFNNTLITYTVRNDCRTVDFIGKTFIKGNNISFKWKFTATDSITQIIPSMGDSTLAITSFTFPPGIDSFTVSLTVTSDIGCGIGRAGKLVVIKPPPPKANFGFNVNCNNLSVPFTDSSLLNFNPGITHQYAYKLATAPATVYTNFSSASSPVFIFPGNDSFDVRLIVTSSLSCVNNDTVVKRIFLQPKPAANFNYTNTCGSLIADFTNTSNIAVGTIAQHRWFLNGLLINSTPTFSYTFGTFGSYTIKYVAESTVGCVSDTAVQTVIIKDKPTINLTTLKDSVCANDNYSLTANITVQATAINSHTWVKNNILLPFTGNAITDNNAPGIYTYKVKALTNQGCSSDTVIKIVTVGSKPVVNINATTNCGTKQISIISAATIINDVIGTHYIDYGDGTNSIANPNNTTHTYINYGTYTLKYIATAGIGCVSDTATQTIIIKDKPIATLTYNNNACANTNFTITANNTVSNATILNQNWFINGVVQSSTANALTANLNAGTYSLQYISNTNQGCVSDTATKIIVVQSNPIVNFTTTNGCVNDALTFNNTTTNTIGNPLNYTWKINNAIETTNTDLIKNFTTGGNFAIQLKASSANGCSDSIQKIVSMETKPIANFKYDSACLQKPVLFTNTSTNTFGTITNFNWNFDNGQTATTPTATNAFTTERNYAVSLTVSTANGCSGSITKVIPIQAVQITATKDTAIAANQPLQLLVTGAATYSWSPGFGLNNPGIPNPIATLQQAQLYQVQGITTAGCVGYANVKITVYKDKGLYIPTIFTPNNDGINDTWKIICSGVQKLNYIKVFNRWGKLVHQQNNCTTAWNGNFNGKALTTGTYIFFYEIIDFTGKLISGKGTVMIAK